MKNEKRTLAGRTAAVTGATGGIGTWLVRDLCALGANVVLVDRNRSKSQALADSIVKKYSNTTLTLITADMEDIDSVFAAADRLNDIGIDLLFLNAGVYKIPSHTCSTGYGNVFQINFVSPYVLACRTIDGIRAKGGRIVAVGSIAHTYTITDSADVDFSSCTSAEKVYGNSKRYFMYAMLGLIHDADDTSIAVCHPGITFTNITNHYAKWLFAIIKYPMKIIFPPPKIAVKSILEGAFTPCHGCEWIGPCLFDIWGTPKKKTLKSASNQEKKYIELTAEKIYINTAKGKKL